ESTRNGAPSRRRLLHRPHRHRPFGSARCQTRDDTQQEGGAEGDAVGTDSRQLGVHGPVVGARGAARLPGPASPARRLGQRQAAPDSLRQHGGGLRYPRVRAAALQAAAAGLDADARRLRTPAGAAHSWPPHQHPGRVRWCGARSGGVRGSRLGHRGAAHGAHAHCDRCRGAADHVGSRRARHSRPRRVAAVQHCSWRALRNRRPRRAPLARPRRRGRRHGLALRRRGDGLRVHAHHRSAGHPRAAVGRDGGRHDLPQARPQRHLPRRAARHGPAQRRASASDAGAGARHHRHAGRAGGRPRGRLPRKAARPQGDRERAGDGGDAAHRRLLAGLRDRPRPAGRLCAPARRGRPAVAPPVPARRDAAQAQVDHERNAGRRQRRPRRAPQR
ncbi:hypothetical protein EMIHUDRAFT_460661, partial [Emiliania huxleyi CCMP1516]|uniref:Uncharacterized protein n=2 Tax=Emiliania huxleyi TaxID=2903 RepID=A0A0D3K9V5_EMIH1